MTKIKFELDGKQVEAKAGETIWQVAKRQGQEIPHLCYSPAPDYRPDGNCRACMVEIEGERVLAASCKRINSASAGSGQRVCHTRAATSATSNEAATLAAGVHGGLSASDRPSGVTLRRSAGGTNPP